MKLSAQTRKGESSATIVPTLALMLGCCVFMALFALTAAASQPGWWTSRDAVDPSLATNDYGVANQGQLKQFTARAVDELNADLTNGGAGPDLTNLVYGWHQDYVTNGYATNTANPTMPYKPSDFNGMTVGQLKYIASLIYAPLAGAGYTGLVPSWITQNTNSDNGAANVGQLKQLFAWDITTTPATITGLTATASNSGEIDLNWTLPTMNNATSYLIEQSTDGGSTWTTVDTLNDPTLNAYAVTGLTQGTSYQFRITAGNGIGSATASSATPTNMAPVAPRYAVIDLGTNFFPVDINSSGVVVGNGTNGFGAQVWGQGGLSPLSTNLTDWTNFIAVGLDDAGHVSGNMFHTTPVPANSMSETGCYWADTNSGTAPIPLGPTAAIPSNPSVFPPTGIAVTAVSHSPSGLIVGYWPSSDFYASAIQFNPAWNDYTTNYWTSFAWGLSGDLYSQFSQPRAASGSTNWCGYGFGVGPAINGTTYTSYPTFDPYGINTNSIVVGIQGTNAVFAVPTSGTSLVVTNLGTGMAQYINDNITIADGTTNATYTPQILGYDGTGTNATLWDKTYYDGTPSTNTTYGGYVAKNLNLLIPGASGTNPAPWHITGVAGINNGGAIAATATYTGSDTNVTSGSHGLLLLPIDLVQETTNGSGIYTQIDTAPVFPADSGVGEGPSTYRDAPKGMSFSFATNLSTSAVGTMYASIGGPGGYFSGTMGETATNSGVFTNAASTVTVTLPVGSITSDSATNNLTATVSSTSLAYTNAVFTMQKNDATSMCFSNSLKIAEISFSAAYNPAVINTMHVNLQMGYINSIYGQSVTDLISLNINETSAGSQTYTDSASGLTVVLSNFTGTNSGSIDTTTASFSGGIAGSTAASATLTETAVASRDFTLQTTTGAASPGQATDRTPDNPTVTGDGIFYVRVKGISGSFSMAIQGDIGIPQTNSFTSAGTNTMISGKLLLVPENATGTTNYTGVTTIVTAGIDSTEPPHVPWYLNHRVKLWQPGETASTPFPFYRSGAMFLGNSFQDPDYNAGYLQRLEDDDYNAFHTNVDTVRPLAMTSFNMNNNTYTCDNYNTNIIGGALPYCKAMYLIGHGITLAPGTDKDIPFQGMSTDLFPTNIASWIKDNNCDFAFLNGCGSMDTNSTNFLGTTYVGQGLNMAKSFRCRAYVGWTKEVNIVRTGIAAKIFFTTFKGDHLISEGVAAVNRDGERYNTTDMTGVPAWQAPCPTNSTGATTCYYAPYADGGTKGAWKAFDNAFLGAFQFNDNGVGKTTDASQDWSASDIEKHPWK